MNFVMLYANFKHLESIHIQINILKLVLKFLTYKRFKLSIESSSEDVCRLLALWQCDKEKTEILKIGGIIHQL